MLEFLYKGHHKDLTKLYRRKTDACPLPHKVYVAKPGDKKRKKKKSIKKIITEIWNFHFENRLKKFSALANVKTKKIRKELGPGT